MTTGCFVSLLATLSNLAFQVGFQSVQPSIQDGASRAEGAAGKLRGLCLGIVQQTAGKPVPEICWDFVGPCCSFGYYLPVILDCAELPVAPCQRSTQHGASGLRTPKRGNAYSSKLGPVGSLKWGCSYLGGSTLLAPDPYRIFLVSAHPQTPKDPRARRNPWPQARLEEGWSLASGWAL